MVCNTIEYVLKLALPKISKVGEMRNQRKIYLKPVGSHTLKEWKMDGCGICIHFLYPWAECISKTPSPIPTEFGTVLELLFYHQQQQQQQLGSNSTKER